VPCAAGWATAETAIDEAASPVASPEDTSSNVDARVLADHPPQSVADVRETSCDRFGTIDRTNRLNRLFTGRYRQRLVADARGRVLDVARGVGTNARYLPEESEYVGIDVSPEMLAKAERHLAARPRDVTLHELDAQELAFAADSFETVISSLSTCTFPDPVEALSEIGRVRVPGGRVLLLEHGRSSVGPVARLRDWRADVHFEKHGCRWIQTPLATVSQSPLATVVLHRVARTHHCYRDPPGVTDSPTPRHQL